MSPETFIKQTLLKMKIGYWMSMFGFIIARISKNQFWIFGDDENDYTVEQIVKYIHEN
jgi:hypothetical protein